MEYKTCKKCGRTFPATEYYFYMGYTTHNGIKCEALGSPCKECRGRPFGHTQKIKIPKVKIIDEVEYKQCTQCEEWFIHSHDNFNHEKNGKLSARCKTCLTENSVEYGKTEKRKEYMKEYRKTEKFKLSQKRRKHRRREREKSTVNDLTLAEWNFALSYWADEKNIVHCAYCGKPIFHPQMDHIIPVSKGGGFTKSNIIPVGGMTECACNQSKNVFLLDEFFDRSEDFTEELYEKIQSYLKLVI